MFMNRYLNRIVLSLLLTVTIKLHDAHFEDYYFPWNRLSYDVIEYGYYLELHFCKEYF